MGCIECEAATNAFRAGASGVCFYRWKHANIVVAACDHHLKEVFAALNAAQDSGESESLLAAERRAVGVLIDACVGRGWDRANAEELARCARLIKE